MNKTEQAEQGATVTMAVVRTFNRLDEQGKLVSSVKSHITPAQSVDAALRGLEGAVLDRSVTSVVIEGQKRVVRGYNEFTQYSPFVTFTRSGPQEFAPNADGKPNQSAWWERLS